MIRHTAIDSQILRSEIRRQAIRFAGNDRLKIYGTLRCTSGKRMNKVNRVFFHTESEAVQMNFRPCGHCMKQSYRLWKKAAGS